jgi:hypothetical protein
MFLRSTVPASSINLLEMQILGPDSRQDASEILGLRHVPQQTVVSAQILQPLTLSLLFHNSDFLGGDIFT